MGLISIERSLTDELRGLKGKWISRKIDLSPWVMFRLSDSLIQQWVDPCSFLINWPWPASNISLCVLGQKCEQTKIQRHSISQTIFWVCLSLLNLRKANHLCVWGGGRILNSNQCPEMSEKINNLENPWNYYRN